MFSLASGIYQNYFATPQLNVLLIGAPGVGKTTLLERIKVTEFTVKAKIQATLAPPPPQKALPPAPPATPTRAIVAATAASAVPEKVPKKVDDHDKKKKEKKQATTTTTTTESSQQEQQEQPQEQKSFSKSLRQRLACPAPQKYSVAQNNDDDDDEYVEDEDVVVVGGMTQQEKWLQTKKSSMDSVELTKDDATINTATTTTTASSTITTQQQQHKATTDSSAQEASPKLPTTRRLGVRKEFNVKPGHKMLPLEKIRPTHGQNLAKMDICGARCHIFDVAGSFQSLWQRYYNDCDAVIFCWRLDWTEEEQEKDSSEEEKAASTQAEMLERVREEIADDVPFLIFGHVVDSAANARQGLLSTQDFLPHYTSNLVRVYCGSAITGEGVREAMEWLIPLAKRQTKLRNQSKLEEEAVKSLS